MDLSLYKFNDDEVRFWVRDGGDVWVHANSACKALGITNASTAVVRHVREKYREKIADKDGVGAPAWYLSEHGLYQLIFSSKAPNAIKFQDWVFEEVLPAIRKNKGYIEPTINPEELERLNKEAREKSKLLLESGEAERNYQRGVHFMLMASTVKACIGKTAKEIEAKARIYQNYSDWAFEQIEISQEATNIERKKLGQSEVKLLSTPWFDHLYP